MEYMQKVGELFERIPEVVDNEEEQITQFLKGEYVTIKEISDYVKQTPMYQDNLERTEEYIESTKDFTLFNRWVDFLQKIVSAPGTLMMQGVVIFHMPLLEDEIRKVL